MYLLSHSFFKSCSEYVTPSSVSELLLFGVFRSISYHHGCDVLATAGKVTLAVIQILYRHATQHRAPDQRQPTDPLHPPPSTVLYNDIIIKLSTQYLVLYRQKAPTLPTPVWAIVLYNK